MPGRWTAAALAAALLACGGPAGPPAAGPGPQASERAEPGARGPDGGPFPSPEALRDLSREGPPPDLARPAFSDVATWTLRGPFPAKIGELPVAAPSALEMLLSDLAQRRAGLVVVSEAMRCVAREVGLFFVENGNFPSPSLQRFMQGRCGATGVGLGFGYFYDSVPPDASEEHIAEVWAPRVEQLAEEYLGAGPRAAGVWLGRRGDRAMVLVATAQRRARLEAVSALPGADGLLHLRGEVLGPAEQIVAHANRGALGYARCEAAPDVALPRFDLACPTDRGDATAWISLTARRPGRLLGDGVLGVLARPSGAEATTWTRPSRGDPAEAASPEAFRDLLLARLNALRARADLPALALEAQESQTAARLAPFYFGSELGMVPSEYGDVVALGLMAGWEVGGTVRDAGLAGLMIYASTDVDRWLGEALEFPGMRGVLLDGAHTRLAVGPLVSREPGKVYAAAVVAGYELFAAGDGARQRQDLYGRLDREFEARGLRFPRRERTLEGVADREASRVSGGAADPREALDVLVREASTRLGVAVQGWILEGRDVEQLALPDGLFGDGAARIAAAVGHYRPPGSAWGRTFVLLVTAPDSADRVARREAPLA